MYRRTLSETIARAMRTFPAVVVTGPRQSGKTTLLRTGHGRTHRYISLENPDVRARARADPVGFLSRNGPPAILDEIQYIPELLNYVKTLIDENRRPGMWLLSGSQNFTLMEGVSQSLAGRAAVLSLLPFSVAEASRRPGGARTVDDILADLFDGDRSVPKAGERILLGDWILRGSYPELRAGPAVDRMLWCASYVQTYLERDVRAVVNVGDLNAFERFIRLCAVRTGQILNLSDLARDTGASVPTARRWLSVLEAGNQVFLLPPYFKNYGKRLIKSPKLYFTDTALATFLAGVHSEDAALDGPMAGALMETAVVAEWIKVFRHRGEIPQMYFWRSRDGIEVDLIIERNGVLYPFEIKASATIFPAMAGGLQKWLSLAGAVRRGTVLADVPAPAAVAPGITAQPWTRIG